MSFQKQAEDYLAALKRKDKETAEAIIWKVALCGKLALRDFNRRVTLTIMNQTA